MGRSKATVASGSVEERLASLEKRLSVLEPIQCDEHEVTVELALRVEPENYAVLFLGGAALGMVGLGCPEEDEDLQKVICDHAWLLAEALLNKAVREK